MSAMQELLDAGSAAHEQVVAEDRAMNEAWAVGALDEWIARKVADERRHYFGTALMDRQNSGIDGMDDTGTSRDDVGEDPQTKS